MKRIILFCTLVLLASAAFVLTSCGNPKETLHITTGATIFPTM